MKPPGVSGHRKHPSRDREYYKALTALMTGHGDEVKVRKVRAKETSPRKQPERQLRAEVIRYLRKKRCIVKRIENAICGRHIGRGIPDLLFFTPVKELNLYPPSRFYFVELKSSVGKLRPEQEHFKALCERSETGYILARSVADIEGAIG